VAFNNIVKMYDILMKDTINMTEDQLKKHKITWDYILKKFMTEFLYL